MHCGVPVTYHPLIIAGDGIYQSPPGSSNSDIASSTPNTLYLDDIDKEYVLPDDVELTDIITNIFCVTVECVRIPLPVYVLKRDTAQVAIDSGGTLHTEGLDNPDASQFSFLTEDEDDQEEGQ